MDTLNIKRKVFRVCTSKGKFFVDYSNRNNVHVFTCKRIPMLHVTSSHFPRAKENLKHTIEEMLC